MIKLILIMRFLHSCIGFFAVKFNRVYLDRAGGGDDAKFDEEVSDLETRSLRLDLEFLGVDVGQLEQEQVEERVRGEDDRLAGVLEDGKHCRRLLCVVMIRSK